MISNEILTYSELYIERDLRLYSIPSNTKYTPADYVFMDKISIFLFI